MPAAIGSAIISLFLSVGAGAVLPAVSAAAIGAFAIGLAAIGAQVLLGSLLTPQQPALRPSDVQQEVRLSVAPRRRSYGRVRVSGAIWWYDTDILEEDRLYIGMALNHGRISGIVSWHVDETEVEVDGSDNITTSPYSSQGCQIHHRLGATPETAYSEMDTVFGVADCRGDGIATVLAEWDSHDQAETQMEAYPNGKPQLRATIDATVCWDPRDPDQDREDDTTWGFSENPVVICLNYMLDADGYGMSWARIEPNLAEWIAAMDICDEEVPLAAGGTARRYRLAGTFDLTERPRDVVARMMSTCDGNVWQRRDGTIGISVGRYVEPSVTISSRDILSYRIERGQDRLTAAAGIRAQYMSPDQDYRETEAEPWPDAATVAALTEDRVHAMDLTWVPARTQARRLMKRAYVRQTAEWRGSIVTNLAGIRAIDERFINVEIDELGISESFEVGKFTMDPASLRCQIELLSVGPEIDEWDPETEEGDPDAVGSVLAFVSSYTATGTAVDPIGDAGGMKGQTALVFVAGSSLPSVPSGWESVQSNGPTSGLGIRCYSKKLEGDETSTTFLGASGTIIVVLMTGIETPTFVDKDGEVTTDVPSTQIKQTVERPYAVLLFGACNSTTTQPLAIFRKGASSYTADQSVSHQGGGFSGVVRVVVFMHDRQPDELRPGYIGDHGTNGMMSFILTPGNEV